MFSFDKTKTGCFTNSLDNGDFVCADFFKDNVKFGLFFCGSGFGSTCNSACCDGSSCGNTELFFKSLYEIR